jgi:hypothetical protein
MVKYKKEVPGQMKAIDLEIDEVKKKIADVKKRWPFHSPKPALFQELENLELELERLTKLKEKQATSSAGE